MSKIAVIGLVGNSAFLSTDRFHQGGETVVAKDIHFEPGGKGFNQAVAVSRMGECVSFLGAVGNDYYSTVSDFCQKEKINATLKIKDGATAYASIITNSSGDTRVTVFEGVRLTAEDVQDFKEEISSADVLLLNNEVLEEVNVRAVEIAKESGTTVILNPAPARELPPFLLENVDLFTPNEFEASALGDKQNLIITLGEKGCFIKEENKTVPAFKMDNVVDTTGAGDTFNGALAVMLSKKADVSKAVEVASAAAGISVTKKYAVSSIPTKEEIQKLCNF